MLSYCTVEPNTLELLKALMQEPDFSKMRLVGGTALALQYGHRKSTSLETWNVNRKIHLQYSPNMVRLRQSKKRRQSEYMPLME